MLSRSPLISVIIPVYNAERYLRCALDSLLAQTLGDWEAICINDGSHDGSAAILDSYAALDNRFVILHTENGGAARARNLGLSAAKGEYITMLDADDWLETTALEKLSAALIASPQVAFSTSWVARHRGKTPAIIWRLDSQGFALNGIHPASAANFRRMMLCSWGKMYRRSIIEQFGLQYREGLTVGEDTYFVLCYFAHTEYIAVVPDALYHYLLSASSVIKDYFNGALPQDVYLGNLLVPRMAGEYAETVEFPSLGQKQAYYAHLLQRALDAYSECLRTGVRCHREYERAIRRAYRDMSHRLGSHLPLTDRVMIPLRHWFGYGVQSISSAIAYRIARLQKVLQRRGADCRGEGE